MRKPSDEQKPTINPEESDQQMIFCMSSFDQSEVHS
jgi:hypothetical protein